MINLANDTTGKYATVQYLQHGCHEKIECLTILFNKEWDSPKEVDSAMHLQPFKTSSKWCPQQIMHALNNEKSDDLLNKICRHCGVMLQLHVAYMTKYLLKKRMYRTWTSITISRWQHTQVIAEQIKWHTEMKLIEVACNYRHWSTFTKLTI
jgi:hypothetical protein